MSGRAEPRPLCWSLGLEASRSAHVHSTEGPAALAVQIAGAVHLRQVEAHEPIHGEESADGALVPVWGWMSSEQRR